MLEEWESLESLERKGPPQFASYFRKNKLADTRERMAKFVMQDLGLGEEPYHQNVPESQDLDKFVMSMYDFAVI